MTVIVIWLGFTIDQITPGNNFNMFEFRMSNINTGINKANGHPIAIKP